MGLNDVREKAIQCLKDGKAQHDNRSGDKNLLKTDAVTSEEVITMLRRTSGRQYEVSQHHFIESVEVHIFKPIVRGVKWYIKLYFIEPSCWFISVHISDNPTLKK
jgi:hypothetical protein